MSIPDQQRHIGTATLLSLAAMAAVGWACSGDPAGQGNGCQSTGADVTINAQDNLTFDKPSVPISKTQSVCWQNLGTTTHTVTADPALPADTTWTINSTLTSNIGVLRSFGTVGDYPYHCAFHAGMRGLIQVR
jgi:plastocyanin